MDKSILSRLAEQPWAILPSALQAAVARVEGGELAPEASVRPSSRAGATAIIPLQGVLRQKGSSFMDELFGGGGGSTEMFAANIRRLAADESISKIVIDVHSPGGEVFGTQEAADAVYEARKSKRVVAVVNSLGASAAYWIASQANEIIVSPSSRTGSIGVFAMHEDISGMAEQAGVKVTLISAGKFKTEGNQFEELTDEARATIQGMVDDNYAQFVAAVARGRGASQTAVRGGYGQGRVLSAKDAVAAGMADRVGTLRDVLAGGAASSNSMAALEEVEIRACCGGPVDLDHFTDCPKAIEEFAGREPNVDRDSWEWLDRSSQTEVA